MPRPEAGRTPMYMRPVLGFPQRLLNPARRIAFDAQRILDAPERERKRRFGTPHRRGSFNVQRLRDHKAMQDRLAQTPGLRVLFKR